MRGSPNAGEARHQAESRIAKAEREVCLSCPKDKCTGSCDYLHGMVMQKIKGIKYNKKVAKTQQERSYNWYEKLRSDPERYQAYLQRRREQNRKRREKKQQKSETGGATFDHTDDDEPI